MGAKHNLALDIPETRCETIFKIEDSSFYQSDYPTPTCLRLDITTPGQVQPIYISDADNNLTQYFKLNLSSEDLGLNDCGPNTLCALPDGVYTIRYSVNPNVDVYVEYYHMRTTVILNKYYAELCKLRLQECEPTREIKEKIANLHFIKTLIEASKAKVEYCHAISQGVDMYVYANKLLDKYINSCSSSCGCN